MKIQRSYKEYGRQILHAMTKPVRERECLIEVVRKIEFEHERRRRDEALLILMEARRDGDVKMTQSEVCHIMNVVFGCNYTRQNIRARIKEAQARIAERQKAGCDSIANILDAAIRDMLSVPKEEDLLSTLEEPPACQKQ